MLKRLFKSMEYDELMDMMYMDKSGGVSQRKIEVLIGGGYVVPYLLLSLGIEADV